MIRACVLQSVRGSVGSWRYFNDYVKNARNWEFEVQKWCRRHRSHAWHQNSSLAHLPPKVAVTVFRFTSVRRLVDPYVIPILSLPFNALGRIIRRGALIVCFSEYYNYLQPARGVHTDNHQSVFQFQQTRKHLSKCNILSNPSLKSNLRSDLFCTFF